MISGSAYGYRPYVMTDFPANNALLSTKDAERYNAALFRQARNIASAEVIGEVRVAARNAAEDLLEAVSRDSSTAQQRDSLLKQALNAIRPGLFDRVFARASDRMARGMDPTATDNITGAITDELSGDSVASWLSTHVTGRSFGARFLNTTVDWHCSPASTAVGSTILNIFGGPAASAAGAAGATEIQQAAGCDIWREVRGLSAQLGINRNVAYELIASGKWVRDPASGEFVEAGSLRGLWVKVRPIAPYAFAAAAVALIASRL